MNYQDELEQQKADAKNNVEEYVYSMRDKVSDRITSLIVCIISLHYIIS